MTQRSDLKARVGRYFGRHRRSPLIRFVASKCTSFMSYYENTDLLDFDSNGERFVLQSLASEQIHCLWDVGANVGDWARMAREIIPAASIHCFEIFESTARELAQRVSGIPGIHANNFGLWHEAGTVRLNRYEGFSTLTNAFDFPHPFEASVAEGKVVTGDQYAEEHGIETIDFVKMDVEGAEPFVIRGFERTFRRGGIRIVQFEYGQANFTTKFLLKDFYEFFANHGFRMGKIYPNYIDFCESNNQIENGLDANYLAVREDQADLIRRLNDA